MSKIKIAHFFRIQLIDLSTAEARHNGKDYVATGHENDVGYLKRSDEKGGDGYQHFESYHNKDGDAFGYEKHEAFGKSSDNDDNNKKGSKKK